ncbi:MAG: hypothetical protein LBC47_09170 [Tannerella sp.]|nr:hypothetical protein [Tannerella sp.]
MIITIAVRNPVRAFRFEKLSVECVKAYVDVPDDSQTLRLIRILDAIKDCRHIPGTSPQTAYDRISRLHVSPLDYANLEKLVSLSKNYPPKVRKILGCMLHGNDKRDLEEQLVATICPTRWFDLLPVFNRITSL